MKSALKYIVAIAAYFGGFSSDLQGAVITSNLSQPVSATNNVSGSDDWVAQKFFNGPSSENLENVSSRLNVGGNVFVAIFSDIAGAPGSMLGTFDINPPLNLAPNVNLFPYTGTPITLSPSTAYWIVVGAQSPLFGNFQWSYTSGPSSGPGSIPQNWAYTNSYNSGWIPQSGFSYAMEINTVVPEPAAISLMALGAIVLLRRR